MRSPERLGGNRAAVRLRGFITALAIGVAVAAVAHAGGLPRVDRYDAKRDAATDIADAVAAARDAHRRVLVIVGGDWCKDCRDLDALLDAHPDLALLRDARYLPVKVYVGTDNRNDAALARFPRLQWVPTLFELDDDGNVARSAPSTQFHDGGSLSPDRVREFLEASPPSSSTRWK
jgi:thiol:disulfide interchange protein